MPTQPAASSRLLLLGGVTFAVVLILDQLTKWLIIEAIGPESSRRSFTIIPAVLDFTFVRNTGSAFGFFQGGSDILKIAALLAVGVLLIYYFRAATRDWVMSLALGLQLGGAVGNIIDRFRFGYVVDFIDFPRFPTFNVADSAITVGVTMLIFALLFRDVDGRQPRDNGSEPRAVVREDA